MHQAPAAFPQSLQDLSPQWAHFCLHIEQFVTGELDIALKGKTLVVGLSGGIDSTALLLVLHYLSKKNGGRVVGVHLNHRIRPEADDDARWCQALCAQLDIGCFLESKDIPSIAEAQGIGLEEAGRASRYSLFNDVLRDVKADHIALAHHLDDLCEDVVMRLVRGTGWPGLAGMPGYDVKRKLVRPFLLTPKSKLKRFLQDNGVEWREDATNEDNTYTRNRVRSTIMPLFLEENPNFPEAVARLWKVGRIDQSYWEEQTNGVSQTIPNESLANAHRAQRLRLFKAALDANGPGQALADTLFKLDAAWNDRRIGATFQFPGEKTARITTSGVVFSQKH